MNTTIQIDKTIVESLRNIKDYPRQTYNELLRKMINVFKSFKKTGSNYGFLIKIQQSKMKELWDNKEDKIWENV